MVPVILAFYNTGLKTVKESSRSRVCINSKKQENVMSFSRHINGPPMGFGDLGGMAIYYPPTKSEGYFWSRPCVCPFRPSTLFVCPEPYLSTYYSDLIHSWYK